MFLTHNSDWEVRYTGFLLAEAFPDRMAAVFGPHFGAVPKKTGNPDPVFWQAAAFWMERVAVSDAAPTVGAQIAAVQSGAAKAAAGGRFWAAAAEPEARRRGGGAAPLPAAAAEPEARRRGGGAAPLPAAAAEPEARRRGGGAAPLPAAAIPPRKKV
jgi:GNAT superfamily N-acetyltransferase